MKVLTLGVPDDLHLAPANGRNLFSSVTAILKTPNAYTVQMRGSSLLTAAARLVHQTATMGQKARILDVSPTHDKQSVFAGDETESVEYEQALQR